MNKLLTTTLRWSIVLRLVEREKAKIPQALTRVLTQEETVVRRHSSWLRQKSQFWLPGTCAFKPSSVPRPVAPRKQQDEFHFCCRFQGGKFLKENGNMLRQGNGNQYTHGDKFNWKKTKVHWNSHSKFPSLKMLFCWSINLMDHLYIHRTSLGLLYPGEMTDLSLREVSPGLSFDL